jgi:O-antigen/teichoic acid export membrane protein
VSLQKNILANYLGQFYMTTVSIVMVPLYLRYLGAETYGLVAFFALMQMWFHLLDLGMGPTLGRQVARYRGGAMSAMELRRLLRAMEGVFFGIAAAGMLAWIPSTGTIADHWLNPETLDAREVSGALVLIGIAVALRWVCGIYRSAIWGFEHQVWLNAFGVAIATLRFVTVIPVFIFVGTSPKVFFTYQLIVAGVELACLMAKTYGSLPRATERTGWSLAPLRGVLTFSLTIAFTSSVWVMVTQMDKLVLSKILPLEQFGYFALGVLVAGAVNLVGAPVTQAMLPRLSRLAAEQDHPGILELYRRATQWVCCAAAPVALGLALFAEPVVWIWTGDRETAAAVAPIVRLYAIGNGLLAIAAFQYYLQFAKGDLRLHLAGNVIFVLVLVPLVIWAASRYGGVGAGWVWLGQCAFFAIAWTWLVHRRFAPGLHWHWLMEDVLPIWGAVLAVGALVAWLGLGSGSGRWASAAIVTACGICLVIAALAASPDLRGMIVRKVSASGFRAA